MLISLPPININIHKWKVGLRVSRFVTYGTVTKLSGDNNLLLVSSQCLPGGGGGGGRLPQGEEKRAGLRRLFPNAQLPQRAAEQGGPPLLHGRAGPKQPPRGHALHRGRQPHVQRLLEQPAGPHQELSRLLSGRLKLQRGKNRRYVPGVRGLFQWSLLGFLQL